MTHTWTADKASERSINLRCNGAFLGAVVLKDDFGGKGWKVCPTSPNHPRSRKYWPDPVSAVKQAFGKSAAEAVALVE